MLTGKFLGSYPSFTGKVILYRGTSPNIREIKQEQTKLLQHFKGLGVNAVEFNCIEKDLQGVKTEYYGIATREDADKIPPSIQDYYQFFAELRRPFDVPGEDIKERFDRENQVKLDIIKNAKNETIEFII